MELVANFGGFIRRAIIALAIMVAAITLLGILCFEWINTSVMVWTQYGDQTFEFWLIGNALVMLLFLVALW